MLCLCGTGRELVTVGAGKASSTCADCRIIRMRPPAVKTQEADADIPRFLVVVEAIASLLVLLLSGMLHPCFRSALGKCFLLLLMLQISADAKDAGEGEQAAARIFGLIGRLPVLAIVADFASHSSKCASSCS